MKTSRLIAESGKYVASRLPGYPVPEYGYALAAYMKGGYFVYNFFAALLSLGCFFVLAAFLRKTGSNSPITFSVLLTAVPVVYIASVCTMDYLWALFFLLLSFVFFLDKRIVVGAIFLGIATGCRITSFAAVVPVFFLIHTGNVKQSMNSVFKICCIALATAAVCYYPVFSNYGLSFFQFYDTQVPVEKMFYRMTVGTWGITGTLGLLIFIPAGALLLYKSDVVFPIGHVKIIKFSLFGMLLFLLLFLRLPLESGYLIPFTAFSLILLSVVCGKFIPKILRHMLVVSILLSPFIFHFSSAGYTAGGPIPEDFIRRRAEENYIAEITKKYANDSSAVIITGWYYPRFEVLSAVSSKWHYVYLLDSAGLSSALQKQRKLFYLQKMEQFNYRTNGINLKDAGARLIPLKGFEN